MKETILYWVFYPFTYWYNFFKEFYIWLSFRRKSKKSKEILEKVDLRVDWIGRVYGVVNVPDEVLGAAEEIQQAYVLKQLGQFGEAMKKIGLANVVYPQIQEIPGSGAYLVIFWPILDRLNIIAILGSIIYTTIYSFLVYLLIRAFIYFNILGNIIDAISTIL
jgi:hypothetical protein